MFGSASADLMMSRAPLHGSSSTGRIPGCNRFPLLAIYDLEERLLDGGVHTRLLEVSPMVSRVAVQQTANHFLVRHLRTCRVALKEVHTSLA